MKVLAIAVLAASWAMAQTAPAPSPQVLTLLKLTPGMVVDIIGGSEDLRNQIRQAVGPLGKVTIAEPKSNGDPNLPVASADRVIMADALLHAQSPERLLGYLRSAIKPLGRLYVFSSPEEFAATASAIENAGFDPINVYHLDSLDSLLEFSRP